MVKKRQYEFINSNTVVICDDVFPLYLITGKKNFLIDCAITGKSDELFPKIKTVLQLTPDLKSRKVDGLCLTHSHYDHVGLGSCLQSFFDFEVYGSEVAVNLLKKKKVADFIDQLNQVFAEELNQAGNIHFTGLKNLHPLKEGDRLPVDENSYLVVYETPGHTRCSLSYLLMPEKILFPGDSLGIMERDQSINPLFLSSYQSYLESLDKIKKIAPEILCFPHNRYLKGKNKVAAFLDRTLIKTESFKTTILTHLYQIRDKDTIAQKIFREEYPVPTVMGPKDTLLINISAMINAIERECLE